MEYKWIKDNIHGYIKIEKDFLKIVNTPEFQRLKWIEQGSFRVLYPSARHDRFIHSLGVFGLARECFDALMENLQKDLGLKLETSPVETWKYTFLYAALLHDVGHAPFSHTSERFFAEAADKDSENLLSDEAKRIIEKVNKNAVHKCDIHELKKTEVDLLNAFIKCGRIGEEQIEGFVRDFLMDKSGINPKTHEVISATILLEKYEDFLAGTYLYDKIDLNTAARMVIGCTYYYGDDAEKYGIENVLIRLLNSSFLDVDKLDYIIRDTKMSGYDNASLDIKRLLGSVTAIRKKDGGIFPAYDKKVLSTIDNLFRAKQQENMWMISHPVVEYEKRLIIACIQEYSEVMPGYKECIFTKEALSQEGTLYNEGTTYVLLSDIDILCDIKTLWKSNYPVIDEYFNSNLRKHPLWKSLYEYRNFWEENKYNISLERVYDFFCPLMQYLDVNNIFTLNENVYNRILKENEYKIVNAAGIFKKLVDKFQIEFSFSIWSMKNDFVTGVDEKNIYVYFDNDISDQKYRTYYELSGKNIKDERNEVHESKKFFYIYSRDKFTTEQIRMFVESTIEEINKEASEKPGKKERV